MLSPHALEFFRGFLLRHEFPAAVIALSPTLLAHDGGLQLRALALVAVSRFVGSHYVLLLRKTEKERTSSRLQLLAFGLQIRPMGERKRKSKIEWQVIRMRARGEHLGTVTAPDEEAAIGAAIKLLALDEIEAKRILVRQYR